MKKKTVYLILVLVLIGGLSLAVLAVPRPTHAYQYTTTYYNVTLTNGSSVWCDRVVYELNGRIECIFASGAVVHYEASQYQSVAFVRYVWPY